MEEYSNEDFFEEDPDKVEQKLEAEEKSRRVTRKKNDPKDVTIYRRTQKRITYARALIEGKTQRQAYLEAYPEHSKWKASSIDTHASAIFHDPEFQKLFEEEAQKVEQELQKQYVWTRGKAVKRLLTSVNLVAEDLEAEYAKPLEKRSVEKQLSKINALRGLINELNQMHGMNKQNIGVDGAFVIISGEDELED